MNESYETARKMADEFMTKAMEQDWSPMDGNFSKLDPSQLPDWVSDACKRMNELPPDACMVHVMRLVHLAQQSRDKGKDALQKFNLALARNPDFNAAMKKLHEEKAKHEDREWFKQLNEAAVS